MLAALEDLSRVAAAPAGGTWRSVAAPEKPSTSSSADEGGEHGDEQSSLRAGGEVATPEARFGPALAELQQAQRELTQLKDAARGLRRGLACQLLRSQGPASTLDAETAGFLENHCACEPGAQRRAAASSSEGALDADAVRGRLELAETPQEFCEIALACLGGGDSDDDNDPSANGGLRVPVCWLHADSAGGGGGTGDTGDTTHQDRRDVERDEVELNGRMLRGAEAKYEGVVEDLVTALSETLDWAVAGGARATQLRRPMLERFARCVLNTANRTHSGGTAFEIVLALFGQAPHLAQVTPASERAPPLQINTQLETFWRYDAEQDKVNEEWGLVVHVSASIDYLLKDPVDVEVSLASLRATFQQTVALSLPMPAFPTHLIVDDRQSSKHRREDYAVWEDAECFAEGAVFLTSEMASRPNTKMPSDPKSPEHGEQ